MTDVRGRFMALVSPEPNTGCWLFETAESSGRYPTLRIGGRKGRPVRASRLAWELYRGPIPQGLVVCHSCDTPSCVNPDHLFIGTQRDNVADAIQKGRHKRPSRWATHCKRGHAYTPENRELRKDGRIGGCHQCELERRRQSRAKRRSE